MVNTPWSKSQQYLHCAILKQEGLTWYVVRHCQYSHDCLFLSASTEVSLDLGLVHPVQSQHQEDSPHSQGPEGVALQRVRVQTTQAESEDILKVWVVRNTFLQIGIIPLHFKSWLLTLVRQCGCHWWISSTPLLCPLPDQPPPRWRQAGPQTWQLSETHLSRSLPSDPPRTQEQWNQFKLYNFKNNFLKA